MLKSLGPGIVTGAADDDPSGIATYTIAGAQQGMSLLWLAWLTWPLMGAIQIMCARIGMVTGLGLAQALRKKFPQWLVIVFSGSLFIANTINIAADLSGMADAARVLSGFKSHLWSGFFIAVFGAGITCALIRFKYKPLANFLKWLAMSLLAYIATSFVLHPDWSHILRQTVSITLPKDNQSWSMIVAVLGTTISPYLFFWQTAQEIEEEKSLGYHMRVKLSGATSSELIDRIADVSVGTLLSNVVMYFIILTAALTLNAHGLTSISDSKEAAEALRPIAGNFAVLIYTTGIIAGGLLAIPTLAGSAAYACAETFRWQEGLNKSLKSARAFYAVIVCSVLGGMALDFLRINPMKALLWSAVVNGLLAPFLMVAIFMVARDNAIMNGQRSSTLNQVMVLLATALMFAAAIGLFVT